MRLNDRWGGPIIAKYRRVPLVIPIRRARHFSLQHANSENT
ncbi:hypothetical protein [Bradyrhizobium symbiodeficiens]|nr:hypothetical protein [Bradyrhizobium symbiodeficiens]